jgi:hypothetical protein
MDVSIVDGSSSRVLESAELSGMMIMPNITKRGRLLPNAKLNNM